MLDGDAASGGVELGALLFFYSMAGVDGGLCNYFWDEIETSTSIEALTFMTCSFTFCNLAV